MKRFFKKFLVVGVISILFISAFIILSPNNSNHSLASLIDKHKYLEEAKGNKMILVGGSNIAMGIDSSMLEDEFDYDVVNMGINAGLGLRFMLNDIKPYMSSGDVVVISPEYSHFRTGLNGESVLNIMLKEVPESIKSIDINHIDTLLTNLPEFLRNRIAVTLKGIDSSEKGLYDRDAFDGNGDIISHLELEPMDINASNNKMGSINNEIIECLNEFYGYATGKGATVYMSYPALFDEQYLIWKDEIEYIDKLLRECSNVPVISNPSDYTYNSDKIFDTIYHVNKQGRQDRTIQLIEDIKKLNL